MNNTALHVTVTSGGTQVLIPAAKADEGNDIFMKTSRQKEFGAGPETMNR